MKTRRLTGMLARKGYLAIGGVLGRREELGADPEPLESM